MSDGLAASFAGLCCVARPNASAGADLLADWPGDGEIVVLGDNDDDGRTGAKTVAAQLAAALKREVRVAFPPDGHKDVRACPAADHWGETPWPER